jgi:hypothetical protein
VGEARQAGHLLVDLGVVFHGAGAQGVKALIDPVVHLGEPEEVADDIHLADLGQREIRPLEPLRQRGLGHIGLRQLHPAPAGDRIFKDQGLRHRFTSLTCRSRDLRVIEDRGSARKPKFISASGL